MKSDGESGHFVQLSLFLSAGAGAGTDAGAGGKDGKIGGFIRLSLFTFASSVRRGTPTFATNVERI